MEIMNQINVKIIKETSCLVLIKGNTLLDHKFYNHVNVKLIMYIFDCLRMYKINFFPFQNGPLYDMNHQLYSQLLRDVRPDPIWHLLFWYPGIPHPTA